MATSEVKAYGNYIAGEWVESASGRTYPITNPASKGSVLGEFQTSVPEDASRAVDAAQQALAGWAETPAPARASVLYRALDILKRRADEIARTITIEEGKPLPDAPGRSETRGEHHRVRRRGGATHVRLHHAVGAGQHDGVHRQASPGRRRHNHALELPHRHTRLENGPGAHLRQHPGLQAGLVHALKRCQTRRGFRGGRAPARRPEHDHRSRVVGGQRPW